MAKKSFTLVDYVALLFLLCTAPLFFYKLGSNSLSSWDEAWYAEIARNILKTGDLFNLTWSGEPYFDHPPTGFWLTALSFKVLGISAFSARLAQAFCGLASLFVTYLLGRELFSRAVGLASALALVSCPWFLFRARSGNLDISLALFFLLTLLLALWAAREKRYLVPFSISFALLLLTKTLVPLAIIPSFVLVFWNTRLKVKDLFLPVLLFFGLTIPWFLAQYLHFGREFVSRIFTVGLPGVGKKADFAANIKQTKEYLHSGVGKWFWPGVGSTFLGLFLFQRRFLVLSLFSLFFLLPFAFSDRGGIWHLIPVYAFLTLSFFGFTYTVLSHVTKRAWLAAALVILVAIYYSAIQVRRNWYEFVDINPYISDEEILSREASKYPEPLYIEGSDFRPAAVFYSEKNVPQRLADYNLPRMFTSSEKFLLITQKSELEKLEISQHAYVLLKEDRDKVLVLKK